MFHQAELSICRPAFATDTLRLEFNTEAIADWNYVDYVKLTGSINHVQASALEMHARQVQYIPHPHAFGEDEFNVQAYDCGGKSTRAGKELKVKLAITPLDDKPVHMFLLDLSEDEHQLGEEGDDHHQTDDGKWCFSKQSSFYYF